MWEFPGAVMRPGETAADAATRAVREGAGAQVRAAGALGTVEHAFSHLRVSYHAVRCSPADSGEWAPPGGGWAWAAPGELERYALPRAQRRIAALALEPRLL
jgi:A/G-specific adenine glycosylase